MTRPLYRHPGAAAARLEISTPDEQEPADEIARVRWLEQMRADVAESVGGVMLRSARPVLLTALPTKLASSPGRLLGWSVRETTGANPYVLRLHNGTDNGADIVAAITGSQGTADNRWFGPGGISFTEGLYVEIITGAGLSSAVEGCVFLGAAD